MDDVVVIGEAIMDVVSDAGAVAKHPGGSPANVALGLARLGLVPRLVTSLGDDEEGHAIAEYLHDAGVVLDPSSFGASATSHADAAIGTDGGARYEFAVTWDIPPIEFPTTPSLIHTGSIAAFLQPGADVVEAALTTMRGSALVTFDPNIRPALIGPHEDALRRFERLVSLSDVVKLNDEDAAWLYPDTTPEAFIGRLTGNGVGLVVMTRGGRGALLATAKSTVEVSAVPTAVVDTIGAGDAFMSRLIDCLVAEGTDASALAGLSSAALRKLGEACAEAAAIAVSRRGAQPPTAAEIARLATAMRPGGPR